MSQEELRLLQLWVNL